MLKSNTITMNIWVEDEGVNSIHSFLGFSRCSLVHVTGKETQTLMQQDTPSVELFQEERKDGQGARCEQVGVSFKSLRCIGRKRWAWHGLGVWGSYLEYSKTRVETINFFSAEFFRHLFCQTNQAFPIRSAVQAYLASRKKYMLAMRRQQLSLLEQREHCQRVAILGKLFLEWCQDMRKCLEKPEGISQAFNIVLHIWGSVRIAGNLRWQATKSQAKIYWGQIWKCFFQLFGTWCRWTEF